MVAPAEASSLSWRIQQESGISAVQFAGEINETADFSELTAWLSGRVELHLQGVRQINSIGAREWIRFVRSLVAVTDLKLAHCSTAIVNHLNMISNFRGKAEVSSFYAPYHCAGCNADIEKLIDIKICFPDPKIKHPPTFTCDSCSHPLEFDELPDHYLAFLQEP